MSITRVLMAATWISLAVLMMGGCSSKSPSSASPSSTVIPQAVVSPASETWVVQAPVYVRQADSLQDVFFSDALHGWAVGANGAIFHTSNGRTWKRQQLPAMRLPQGVNRDDAMYLSEVVAVDANHAWALASASRSWIYATADGGRHWRLVAAMPRALAGLAFVSQTTGWAAYAGVLHTTDGGRHWTTQLEASGQAVGGVACLDATHVWVTRGGDILSSSDGGRTWTRRTPHQGLSLGDIQFVDAKHGWAIGEYDTPGYQGVYYQIVLSTRDGGATWRLQRIPDGSVGKRILLSLSFSTEKDGWVIGYDDWLDYASNVDRFLLRTTDGGASWRIEDPLASVTPSRVLPAGARHHCMLSGVACPNGGRTYLVGDYDLILSR